MGLCHVELWLKLCLTAPKSTADVQLDLMEQESAATGDTGQTSWIATGLKIEESQSVLKSSFNLKMLIPGILSKDRSSLFHKKAGFQLDCPPKT